MGAMDTATAHLMALADGDPNAFDEDDRCDASGPGGYCCRSRGHFDDADVWPVDKHVSFDADHYKDWPVGWKSREQLIAEIKNPSFGLTLRGNDDYRKGVEDALRLVRALLR